MSSSLCRTVSTGSFDQFCQDPLAIVRWLRNRQPAEFHPLHLVVFEVVVIVDSPLLTGNDSHGSNNFLLFIEHYDVNGLAIELVGAPLVQLIRVSAAIEISFAPELNDVGH